MTPLHARTLHSSFTREGCEEASAQLQNRDIGALEGGNGSQTGAGELAQQGMTVIGIASTIDNDLYGTDISIGATECWQCASARPPSIS